MQNKAATQHNYDRLSRIYDLLSGGIEQALSHLGLKMLAVNPGERVLEVGFGTGHSLIDLAALVTKNGAVVGIDLSPKMAAEALKKLKRKAKPSPVLAGVADGVQMPFAPACFDAVWMSFTLELFCDSDALLVLNECRRVLKQGGRLGLVSLARTSQPGFMERLYVRAQRSFPSLIDCHPIEVEKMLTSAGFQTTISNRRSLWGLPVDIVVSTSWN